jgi:hypothetical protein
MANTITQKISDKELNDWYGKQPFDNVEKITRVQIWLHPEADDIKEGDTETKSRDEALDEAKEVWNKMHFLEKEAWREKLGDFW